MTTLQQVITNRSEQSGLSPRKLASSATNKTDNPHNLTWAFKQLRKETYIIRPKEQLGTSGWCSGVAWQAEFVTGLHKAAERVNQLNSVAEPQHLVEWRKAKAKAQHASN